MNYSLFVRCVGIGNGVYQKNKKKSYDHRLICFLNDGGEIYIENEKQLADAGMAFFIRPGTAYRVCCSENQSIAVINFDTGNEFSSRSEPILSVDEDSFNPDKILVTPNIPFIPTKFRLQPEDLSMLYGMYDCYLRSDLTAEAKEFCLSSQLSYILSRSLILNNNSSQNSLSAEIYKYIIDNAHSKIRVTDIVKHFNYSESFIEKTLRKNYNTSFRQLVIETRLKKALWYLENTDLSCQEIAIQLGFSSIHHFSNAFAKKYGKRPSKHK